MSQEEISARIKSLDDQIRQLESERDRRKEELRILRNNEHSDYCELINDNAQWLLDHFVKTHQCGGDDFNWSKADKCLRCALLQSAKERWWDSDYTIKLRLEKFE